MATLKRLALWGVGIVFGLYLLLCVGLFFGQRSMMYFPDPTYHAPDRTIAPIEEVRLPTPDGQTLIAWYLPPSRASL